MNAELTKYRDLLTDIKIRVRQAQTRAALSANAEMILMYWDVGRIIDARQTREGWGAGVIPRLAIDLKNELPEEKGFSESNLKRMVQFFQEYPALISIGARSVPELRKEEQNDGAAHPPVLPIGARSVPQLGNGAPIVMAEAEVFTQLGWGQNIVLMQKIKDLSTRLWYARQALEQGWTRDDLIVQIRNRGHERQGAAVTNFSQTLPPAHSNVARQLLKDPYLFDFLTLEEPFHERELEISLLSHIQKFLLELGRGFAFVGRQYRLVVGDHEFFLDLLFYHLHLRCFVVVDLKKGEFKPEYAGKMNFYCSVADDQLRGPQDQPTLGLVLCQTKDRILAEYALRDIHKPIGVAGYELTRALPAELTSSLPSIESIEAELSRELGTDETT